MVTVTTTMSDRYAELDAETLNPLLPEPEPAQSETTYGEIKPGDVIRAPASLSWWTVTQVERGTYPIMVNLWVRNWNRGKGNHVPVHMVCKLGADKVYRINGL